MADPSRPQTHSQISHLPGTTTHITTHSPSGTATIHSSSPVPFTNYENNVMAMGVLYTTTFPSNLSNETDISTHTSLLASGKLGLVNPGGTVCRMVDFSPNYTCMMHRTQSLDFGIVIEGEIEMVLDSGETVKMKRGDVAVQRATMHAWRNCSDTEWARMVFVLQDCQKPEVGGKLLGEDLGRGVEGLPPSGHDA